MLDGGAGCAFGLGDEVAQEPEGVGLRLAGGDDGVGDEAVAEHRGKQALEELGDGSSETLPAVASMRTCHE